jgi:fructuronate reductase
VRDAAGARTRVLGSLRETLVAPESPSAVLERIAAADTRIVSLTITEKGYAAVDDGSAVDLIVRGLARRRSHGADGPTLLSLDNLPSNGRRLRERVLQRAADAGGDTLTDWIAARCTFPNSMVDRIVPRTTAADIDTVSRTLGAHDAAPVIAEPFFDWVVEDRFAAGRPDWRASPCVRFTADAAPWEQLKLRCVNGAHSQIAYLGAMAGWPTVDAALARPALAAHLEALLRDEVEPTLPPLPGLDRDAWRDALLARWRNPALAHRCQQIAMDGSQKIPQRWVAPLAERLAAGAPITRLAFGVAAWMHYLRGVDEAGVAYPIDDPLAHRLVALGEAARGDAATHVQALLGLPEVFGPVTNSPKLAAEVTAHLNALRGGVEAALRSLAATPHAASQTGTARRRT